MDTITLKYVNIVLNVKCLSGMKTKDSAKVSI